MDPNRGQIEEKGVTSDAAAAKAKTADKAPAKPAVVAPLAPGQITVNVLNAGRVKGRAAEVARDLRAKGYKVGKVENSKTSYSVPVVLIPSSMQREAQRIMRVSGITTMDTVAQGGNAKTVTVVVK
jgi:DNA topoisomerase IA